MEASGDFRDAPTSRRRSAVVLGTWAGSNLSPGDSARTFLADHHAGTVDWLRRTARVGLPPDLRRNRILARRDEGKSTAASALTERLSWFFPRQPCPSRRSSPQS